MKKIILLLSVSIACTTAKAQSIIGITTDDKIFEMAQANSPGTITTPISITGISAGQTIAGIDYRPNTGELYALGYNAALSSGNARLYVINKTTGAATAIGTNAIDLNLGNGSISIDFNPTVDRIRIVGANGKNYRLHPVTGAIVATDGDLAYATGDVNSSTVAQIGACAYTNSYIGSESTTLYDYDKNLNILATQVPPNNGTLNTIGSSGIMVNNTAPSLGMDIYFDPVSKTNMAYLNANTGSGSNDNLYSLNLTTGSATLVGQIGTGINVKDIAVVIDRTVPATYSGQLVYGLTTNNRKLIKFSTGNPELIRELLPISGVTAGQVIVGMDVRPADLGLYALGYNSMSREYQVYQINTSNGVATAVNTTPGMINLGTGEKISFDFNPTVDRIRVVSTNDSNYRINPATGAIGALDTNLAFAATDIHAGVNPHIGSVAYINSYKGATTTAMYGIEDSLQSLVQINPPNRGTIITIADNILMFNPADLTSDIDFYYDSVSMMNMGYLHANTNTSVNDKLYSINTNGTVTLINDIGMGIPVSDIAVQLTFTNTSTNSIAELHQKALYAVYPNPAYDELHIVFSENTAQQMVLNITDISGKTVLQQSIAKGASEISISVNALSNGLYFLNSSIPGAKAVSFMKQ
jgi:hypothetical protein